MKKFLFATAAAVAAFAATPATASVLFDSQALGEPLCGTATCVTEERRSDRNYAAVLQFAQDVTISQFGVFSSVNDAQNVKFLIFDSALNGGTGDVLFSQTKAFDAQGAGFLYTDALSFTFLAGRTYDLGILGDGVSLTGRWIIQDLTANGITEISRNANISGFDSPTTGGYSGVSPYIQLIGAMGAVPEPATWAFMIFGFGAVGGAMRRQRKANVKVSYA
ncbi:PEPxxWA-CTERM sorting domain-containing protein [Parasphingorhabdus sp.]|uniref:PEPxxWA-CTERM sorting domain-containing protein n=1 Tax=Parasphingorhabdus sp. TaxID=2709688 RepID=UPI003BAF627E